VNEAAQRGVGDSVCVCHQVELAGGSTAPMLQPIGGAVTNHEAGQNDDNP
jgi:hypothetical protein